MAEFCSPNPPTQSHRNCPAHIPGALPLPLYDAEALTYQQDYSNSNPADTDEDFFALYLHLDKCSESNTSEIDHTKDYPSTGQERAAESNKPTPKEMPPEAECIHAMGSDSSFVEEDNIQRDPEDGRQLALSDTLEHTTPQDDEGRRNGRRKRFKNSANTLSARRMSETSKAAAHDDSPTVKLTRARKRQADEQPTTFSNKRVAVERGEMVDNLAQSSQEPIRPLSPSTASHLDDGRLSVPHEETMHGFDNEFLDRLGAEGSLGDKLINHSLKKLAEMVPSTVRALNCFGGTAPDSDYTWHQYASPKRATKPITLLAINIMPPSSSVDHWVLAVLDSSGVRLLDSNPTEEHKKAAAEKIELLFRGRSTVIGPITTVNVPRASSANSGIAIFWSAVYVIGLSLGIEIHLPETFDPAPWRIAMASFLRATSGHGYNIPWHDDTESLAVTLNDGQIVQRLPLFFKPGIKTLTITPDSFMKDLRQQITFVEQAKKDVNMKKAGEWRYIRMFLGGLMEGTEKEGALLEKKKKDYQVVIESINEVEKCWGEDSMGRLAHENVQQVQACDGLRKDMAVKISQVVEELDHGIKKLENT